MTPTRRRSRFLPLVGLIALSSSGCKGGEAEEPAQGESAGEQAPTPAATAPSPGSQDEAPAPAEPPGAAGTAAAGADASFLLPIEDVFSITGRGTVVTGRVSRGVIKVGDPLEVVGIRETRKTSCTGIEMFRKEINEAKSGDNIGCLVEGLGKDDVTRGMVLATPGTVRSHTKFKATIELLTKKDGGREAPMTADFRPQFYIRTMDVSGGIILPKGITKVDPGAKAEVEVELIASIALEVGLRFAIRDSGKTLGQGVVTSITE